MSEGGGKRRRISEANHVNVDAVVGISAAVASSSVAAATRKVEGGGKGDKGIFQVGAMKRLMAEDEVVGRVSDGAAVLIGKCCELFLERILTKSMERARAERARDKDNDSDLGGGSSDSEGVAPPVSVSEADLRAVIREDPLCDFLLDVVGEEAPEKVHAEKEEEKKGGGPTTEGGGGGTKGKR